MTGSATFVQFPKFTDKGYTFRKDGRYLVLAERHKSKDTLGVYDALESYKLVRVSFLQPAKYLSLIRLFILKSSMYPCLRPRYPLYHFPQLAVIWPSGRVLWR